MFAIVLFVLYIIVSKVEVLARQQNSPCLGCIAVSYYVRFIIIITQT